MYLTLYISTSGESNRSQPLNMENDPPSEVMQGSAHSGLVADEINATAKE